MNEKIRLLAKQADPDYTGEYDDDMGHALVGNEAIQKFAELIVRECIDQLYYTREERMDDTICQAIKERIEKRFGVEE